MQRFELSLDDTIKLLARELLLKERLSNLSKHTFALCIIHFPWSRFAWWSLAKCSPIHHNGKASYRNIFTSSSIPNGQKTLSIWSLRDGSSWTWLHILSWAMKYSFVRKLEERYLDSNILSSIWWCLEDKHECSHNLHPQDMLPICSTLTWPFFG